jgi:hypothetical protein
LQDYSAPMLDQARQRLAGHADQLRYVLCDLTDPSWPRQVGGPFAKSLSAARHKGRLAAENPRPWS